MSLRCPESPYLGIARLQDYRWMINERGYANIVQIDILSNSKNEEYNQVWGLVYALTASDTQRLDINEGVPYAYTKEMHHIDFWPAQPMLVSSKVDITQPPEKREMLVYIDRLRTSDNTPKDEYIYRMNMGILDALKAGIPKIYVDKVMRKFIPAQNASVDNKVKNIAFIQAKEFEGENN